MIENRYFYGLYAEKLVTLYLMFRGYKILARRYKTNLGEIDIIAKKEQQIVAFEVKARKDKKLITGELVSERQKNRIKNAMNLFLSKNPKYIDYNICFSIILYVNVFNFQILEGYF